MESQSQIVNDDLQAATAAISPKGINTFFKEAIEILMQQSISAPDKPGVVKGQYIPIGPYVNLMIFAIDLADGKVSQLKATLTSATQKAGGVFSVVLKASFSIAYAKWHESGTEYSTTQQFPFDHTVTDFWFNIDSIDLSFDITISMSGSSWVVNVTNAAQANVTTGTIHVPRMSMLNDPAVFSCINDKIRESLTDTIKQVTFAKSLADALNGFLETIPTSGKLTEHITFNFPPTAVSYPEDKGILAGITGLVQYDTTAYGGAAVKIPLPTMDNTRDVVINAGTYEFNALLWGFYKSNFLNLTIVPSMLPNPEMLNTNFYKVIFPQLYAFAPGAYMNIDIAATDAPVVRNDTAYWLTSEKLLTLATKIPATALKKLSESVFVPLTIYPTKDSFEGALGSLLTAVEYTATIGPAETAAACRAMFVTTKLVITVSVIKPGGKTFAISFNLMREDILLNYALTLDGTVQSIKFSFSAYNSTATLVKSDIGPIDPGKIDFMWGVAEGFVTVAMQVAGVAGVPLPFIKGFLFKNALIAITDNYVMVSTDVIFGSVRTLLNANNGSPTVSEPFMDNLTVHRLKENAVMAADIAEV